MSDSDFLHGEPLAGKYEVAASISRGGRFDVYLAYHARFGWPVALKVLQARFAKDLELARQVEEQLELVSKQAHPNLVPIYEVGRTAAAQPFAAMAYLEGNTLAQWAQELDQEAGPISTKELLAITRQMALGAATLHRAGVVHPELNPANVLMSQGSMPVLAGLGLPPVAPDPVNDESSAEMTQYRAPEVRSGQAPDARSNIFSLGLILYEMLSMDAEEDLRWPGGTAPTLPLERIRNDLSAETVAVVNTCLKKEVDERYQSMDDVIAGLDKALVAESEGGVGRIVSLWSVSSARRWFADHRRTILTAAAVMLLAIFVVAFLLLQPAVGGTDSVQNQNGSPLASITAAIDPLLLRRVSGQIELMEPLEEMVIELGDELSLRWCWSEQPNEQEQFAISMMFEDRERRLNAQIERIDVFCYGTTLEGGDFSDKPGVTSWRIKLIDKPSGVVVVASEWRTLTLEAPFMPATDTPTPTATLSPTPTSTPTPTATPTASPTPTDTPTTTPTATLVPPTPTATEPPPTATNPPPTSPPPTSPPPTSPPATPTPPPPIPTATPP